MAEQQDRDRMPRSDEDIRGFDTDEDFEDMDDLDDDSDEESSDEEEME